MTLAALTCFSQTLYFCIYSSRSPLRFNPCAVDLYLHFSGFFIQFVGSRVFPWCLSFICFFCVLFAFLRNLIRSLSYLPHSVSFYPFLSLELFWPSSASLFVSRLFSLLLVPFLLFPLPFWSDHFSCVVHLTLLLLFFIVFSPVVSLFCPGAYCVIHVS